MKEKVNFISATTPLFANPDLESLAFDPDYLKAIIRNSGSSPSLSIPRLAKAYLAGKFRAHSSLRDARKRSFGVREEHRVSLELWDQVLPILIQREQENTLSRTAAVIERRFFIVPSDAYFGAVYGQMNKFCLGFEYILWRVSPTHTTWEETQAAILFLRSLQRSFSSSMVQLWKDRWTRQIGPDRPPSVHQGLNIGGLSGRTGFGWFSPLFDWNRWTLKDQYISLVLQEHPRLLQHYQVKYASLRETHGIFIKLQLIEHWWRKHESVAGVKLALVEYLCGLCIAQFRKDIWGYLLERGEVSREHKTYLTTMDVPLCYLALKLYLADKEPWFVTGNKADVKTIPALAAYLFDEEPYVIDPKRGKEVFKDRRGWNNKTYRIIFYKCLALLNRAGTQEWAELLDGMVKSTVSTQNFVLPYPDPTGFFAKTKQMRGRGTDAEVKSRRMWAAVWVKEIGPASLLQEHGLRERFLAYDANQIMERAKVEDILRFGGRLQANADVEPNVPYISRYSAEWHDLSNDELEYKLCYDAVDFVDREAQWQRFKAFVDSHNRAQVYSLRCHINADQVEANNEPEILSLDAKLHQESDYEQDANSSGYESDYNPRRRGKGTKTKGRKYGRDTSRK